MSAPRIEDFVTDAPTELQRAKREAGLCGHLACMTLATHRLVHVAQMAQLVADSAGTESLRRGFPADGSHINSVELVPVTVELCCRLHVDDMLADVRLTLDDTTAEPIAGAAPESHGERRGRR